MWEKPSFSREQITETFDLSLRYLYAKEEGDRHWTTDVAMNVDSLDATLNRKQFIFLQFILDNQLADIRDVSATRTKDNQMQLSETQRILNTKFLITVRDFKVRLRQNKNDLMKVDELTNWDSAFQMIIQTHIKQENLILATKQMRSLH